MSGRLDGRLVALGVTGSIAAYKAVELLRLLTAEGADVVVMLSPSATRFVGPLSFAALSRHPVETEILDLLPDGRIGHIVIADSADVVVVAPATAHWLGSMASGLAGDVVTAACLATSAPVVVAPAMDGDMWTHPATRDNVDRLRSGFGYVVVDPETGPLASGQSGVGRLADLASIVDAVVEATRDRPIRQADDAARPPLSGGAVRDADLAGRHIVVTAGGTREPIDPVRFIGNRSTGRMGVAVAAAALDRGARVTLIAANTEVPLPINRAAVVRVETASELRAALLATLFDGNPESDVAPQVTAVAPRDAASVARFDALVMAAAVSDFRPVAAADTKIDRGANLTLELEATPDLLGEMARIVAGLASGPGADLASGRGGAGSRALAGAHPRPILVGFAAETGSLERAADKLRRKGLDLLVANDVTEPGSGFGTDTNRVVILERDGQEVALPLLSKREVADRLLDRIARLLDDRDAEVQTAAMKESPR